MATAKVRGLDFCLENVTDYVSLRRAGTAAHWLVPACLASTNVHAAKAVPGVGEGLLPLGQRLLCADRRESWYPSPTLMKAAVTKRFPTRDSILFVYLWTK